MRRALSLIALYTRVSVQNFAAYRFDLMIRPFVSAMHLIGELVAVWTIFHNTSNINGWRWQHMLIIVGVYRLVAGGIRMSIVPNMQLVLEEIRDGKLDFVLMRPVNSQFLVSIREFVVWRLTDVILGSSLAMYGCIKLTGHVPLLPVIVFLFTLIAGFIIVYAIWLMLATLCFWFVRIANIEMVFWNVFEAGRFPVVIYPPWVQWLLTFVIPMAFITTIPAAALANDPATGIPTTAPLFAIPLALVMFFAASWFWRFGLRRYSGASA